MAQRRTLRTGYTTGTCAAAAAKGALALLLGKRLRSISLMLPGGRSVRLRPRSIRRCGGEAVCEIVKQAGDDPDVTNGAVIAATVALRGRPAITIRGGEGVGRVTRPGLAVAPGRPAINPVPRKMIRDALRELLPKGAGAAVTISVPGGAALAQKTLNPRLGITGGISILGTTGEVIPYSHAAYRDSIVCALAVARAAGAAAVVLSTGKSSERDARKHYPGLPEEAFVLMGDYYAFGLRQAAKHGIKKIILSCFPGKLLKMAAGAECTHCSRSAIDMQVMADMASACGARDSARRTIAGANTVRHACMEMPGALQTKLCRHMALLVKDYVEKNVSDEIVFEVLVLSYKGGPVVSV
ncbi:cobalt-precorrin-5B (C(1))-methyltransferase [Thermodesulfobacteriota bacterium]